MGVSFKYFLRVQLLEENVCSVRLVDGWGNEDCLLGDCL